MKIGFIGGTFSPPHLGHLHSARVFIEEMSLDKLIIIPARVSPFKAGNEATASDEDRYRMVLLCFKDLEKAEVSRLELDKNETSYTIETIRILKKLYPDDELYMFVGSDMFLSLEKWRRFEEIFKSCTIYTRCRKENEAGDMTNTAKRYEQIYGAKIILSKDKEIIVSSTMVREAIDIGDFESCKALLPKDVLCYIKERRLYF